MTVANLRVSCPGVLVEQTPGSGTCDRGDGCEAIALRADYFAYRDAHARIESAWNRPRSER